MRKIEIRKWKIKDPVGKDIDQDFIIILKSLLNTQKPESLIRGIEKFRLFGRLGESFEKAQDTKFLELEEGDYEFLKRIVEKEIPSKWGMKKELLENVEIFMKAETFK